MKLVKITFLDHCTTLGGINKPITCIVFGLLISEDKTAYYVASWIAENKIDENTDTSTILKSAVKKIERIRKEKL